MAKKKRHCKFGVNKISHRCLKTKRTPRSKKYKHAMSRAAVKMSPARASKFCSKKHGYTTKAARYSCLSRRISGKFAG
jgi:hypothetical protein